jgi:hypothetical protein
MLVHATLGGRNGQLESCRPTSFYLLTLRQRMMKPCLAAHKGSAEAAKTTPGSHLDLFSC